MDAINTSTLTDRNVLVTGGASGLGQGFVRAFVAAKARVIVADYNEERGRALESELTAIGHVVKFLKVDVTSAASIASMLSAALKWLPDGTAIDAAVLSAGITGNAFDLTPEDPSALSNPEALDLVGPTLATVHVNLTGVLQTVQLLVKYGMGLGAATGETTVKETAKSVTLIGSIASYRSLPRAVDYSASKWGIRGAFRSLRQQLPKIGVRVNMIAPGFVKTPLLATMVPMYEQMGVEFTKQEDVVDAVMRVTSDMKCSGRAFGVSSAGVIDFKDESKGMDGSEEVNRLVASGALGKAGCPMGYDEQAVLFQ